MLEALVEPAQDRRPGRLPAAPRPVTPPHRQPFFRRPSWDLANPLRTIRIGGLIGALMMACLGGHLAVPIGQQAPSTWLGLLGAYPEPYQRGLAGASLITGLVVIAWAFLRLARMANDGRLTVRQVAFTAVLWSLPFVIAPPLMSLDVHSYIAQGAMLDRGVDPYHFGPEFIRGSVYDATDPRWRAAHAPYGPLALLISRGAFVFGAHSALWGVVMLRVVAVLAVITVGFLVVRLASNKPLALALATCSPLVLITLISAAHHEAVVSALVVAAVVAERSRHSFLAVVFASAALADKLPGAVALGAIGMLHLLSATGWPSRAWVLARDGLAVATVWVPLGFVVPDPLGWVQALSTPGLGHTGYAPVSIVAYCTRIPENGVRAVGEFISVAIVARLILTLRRRPLEATIGWALLAVALLGPVLYPWYLAPAAIMLGTLPTVQARFMSAACGVEGLLVAVPRIGPWKVRRAV